MQSEPEELSTRIPARTECLRTATLDTGQRAAWQPAKIDAL